MSEQSPLKAWVNSSVIDNLTTWAEEKAPLETGGCFMGYWLDEHTELVITHAIGPGPRAVHKRNSFRADFDWQQERIHEIYQGSGRRITYLGDWHTHPDGTLSLSSKDEKTLSKIARYKAARTPLPIMGVYRKAVKWELIIWRYESRKHLRILRSGFLRCMELCYFEE